MAITVVEVITMDGVEAITMAGAIIVAGAIIAIGETALPSALEEAASVWRLLHLREAALAAWPRAKAAKVSLDGSCRCVAFA
jgi:hypothetical protein